MTRTSTAGPKQRLYGQLARVAKALASPPRLELVEILAQGERSVDAIARVVRMPVANVSHHLRALRDAGLVTGRKEGLFVHYRLADPRVFDLYRLLVEVGRQRLSEIDSIVQQYFEGRDGLEPVGRSALLERIREGSVIVLDVRPPEEYAAGHVPGAVAAPAARGEPGSVAEAQACGGLLPRPLLRAGVRSGPATARARQGRLSPRRRLPRVAR
jgi:ArsR family transcriptional regulator